MNEYEKLKDRFVRYYRKAREPGSGAGIPDYKSAGYKLAPTFVRDMKLFPVESVYDYGCGNGWATKWFTDNKFNTLGIDITGEGIDPQIKDQIKFLEANICELPDDLPPSDWCYCLDTLQHLNLDQVDPALANIRKKTLKGGAIGALNRSDGIAPGLIGERLLIIKEKPHWWEGHIKKYFNILHFAEDTMNSRYIWYVEVPKEEEQCSG